MPGRRRRDGGQERAADRKEDALRRSGTLNPRPGDVTDARFASGGFFDSRDMVQVKYEMVRGAREDDNRHRGSVRGRAVRAVVYQAAAALEEGGLAALVPRGPGPKGGPKLTAEVIAWIGERKAADPGLRAAQLAAMVGEQFGIRVHPRSVQRALARPDSSKSAGQPG